MIVYLTAGDGGLEWEAAPEDLSDLSSSDQATLIEIPDTLWASYQAAQQLQSDLFDAIEHVGRKLDEITRDLVVNAEHLVSHHGYNRAHTFHIPLSELDAQHVVLHNNTDVGPVVPHVHGGRG